MADKSIVHTGLVVILAIIILSACSPKIRTTSHWQPSAAAIDNPASWHEIAAYNSETGIGYGLSNDSHHLYVHLQMDRPATQMKMLRAGMEVSIDTLGRKRGHSTIMYPETEARSIFSGAGTARTGAPSGMTQGRGMARSESESDQRAAQREMIKSLIEKKDRMRLSGFKNHPNGSMPLRSETGMSVQLSLDTVGILHYRAIIPLQTIYRDKVDLSASDKDFALIITIHGIDMPQGPTGGMMRSGGNQGRGGMGGNPSGGMTGSAPSAGRSSGRPGGMPGNTDFQEMGKKESLIIQFNLAPN